MTALLPLGLLACQELLNDPDLEPIRPDSRRQLEGHHYDYSGIFAKRRHTYKGDKDTIELIYGSIWPEGHFGREIAKKFAERVTKKTGGRIIASVTSPSSDSELTKSLLEGDIQMTSGHSIQEYVPQLALSYLPYLYRDFDHFRKIWTIGKSPVSDRMVEIIEESTHVKMLGYSLIGYRDIILKENHLIQKPEDFIDLKIRNDGSSTTHDLFTVIGANPINIEYSEVKEALANGVVQAAANTSFNLIFMEWYQICQNISLTSHQMLLNCELANADFWNGLTHKQQGIIQKAMKASVKDFCNTAAVERDRAITKLRDEYGLQINEVSPFVKEELASLVFPMKKELLSTYKLEHLYNYILTH